MNEIVITGVNFTAEVENSAMPVLLDFWATWCGPCRMIAPFVAKIAEEYPSLKVGKVNVDEEEGLAIRFGIVSIPTLIVMKDGKKIAQSIGYKSYDELVGFLQSAGVI